MNLPKIYYTANPNLLVNGTASAIPQWIKITKTYTDFSIAGLTNDIEIYSLPAKGVIHSVILKHSTLFTGGAIASYTISTGIIGTLAKYSTAFNVQQAVGNTVIKMGIPAAVPSLENFGVITSIRGAAISTVANLNTATQGSVDFYILVSLIP